PNHRVKGLRFVSAVPRHSAAFVEAMEQALAARAETGLSEGHPMTGVHVVLIAADNPDGDLGAAAFDAAAELAFQHLRFEGAPRLLEPVMQLKISMPVEFQEAVTADLLARGV